MATTVTVAGWPRSRLGDNDVYRQFGNDIISYHEGHDGNMRVVYKNETCAMRMIDMLDGSMPAGCDRAISMRLSCQVH